MTRHDAQPRGGAAGVARRCPFPHARLTGGSVVAALILCVAVDSGANTDPRTDPPLPDGSPSVGGGQGTSEIPWLDEVRAQREAWEARRHAREEDFEARQRLSDPRRAARQEAWQDEVRRRREARRQRIEEDREFFRWLGFAYLPSQESGGAIARSAANDPNGRAAAAARGEGPPLDFPPAPRPWDDLGLW